MLQSMLLFLNTVSLKGCMYFAFRPHQMETVSSQWRKWVAKKEAENVFNYFYIICWTRSHSVAGCLSRASANIDCFCLKYVPFRSISEDFSSVLWLKWRSLLCLSCCKIWVLKCCHDASLTHQEGSHWIGLLLCINNMCVAVADLSVAMRSGAASVTADGSLAPCVSHCACPHRRAMVSVTVPVPPPQDTVTPHGHIPIIVTCCNRQGSF